MTPTTRARLLYGAAACLFAAASLTFITTLVDASNRGSISLWPLYLVTGATMLWAARSIRKREGG